MKTLNAGSDTGFNHELRPYAENFHKLFLRNDTRKNLGENSAYVRKPIFATMKPNQPTLFDAEQPAAVECSGPELQGVLVSLRARGATVYSMTAICVGRWRLNLQWPPVKSGHLPFEPIGARISSIPDAFDERIFHK